MRQRTRHPRMLKQAVPPLIAICAVIFSLGSVLSAAEKTKSASDTGPKHSEAAHYERPTDPSLYVGAETCKTCHEDIFKNFETTPHFVTTLENKRGPEWQGCEACHGPARNMLKAAATRPRYLLSKAFLLRHPVRAAWTATPTEKSTAILRAPPICKITWVASTVILPITPAKANS